MTRTKQDRMPELARWKYKVRVDVEETRLKAEKRGFSCRPLEGQPKNKKGKDGWGEHYPLDQCEIKGGKFLSNVKMHIAPKATQIFFFGDRDMIAPTDLDELERFLESMERLVDDLEETEKILNELVVFAPGEKRGFGLDTRTQVRVPSMYRLSQAASKVNQQVLDKYEDLVFDTEFKAFERRDIHMLNALLHELTSFQLILEREFGMTGLKEKESTTAGIPSGTLSVD